MSLPRKLSMLCWNVMRNNLRALLSSLLVQGAGGMLFHEGGSVAAFAGGWRTARLFVDF